MTNPVQEQPRLPLRSFAMMLLSAAVVFFAVGWYSLREGGSFDPDPASRSAAITSEVTEEAPPPPPVEETEETSAAPTTTQLPPPPAPTPDIYVLNNSMVQGLAGQVASRLRNSGWPVADTGNYGAGIVWTTTVFYTGAPGEQELAQRVAATLGATTAPRIPGLSNNPAGVIVVVTQDQVG